MKSNANSPSFLSILRSLCNKTFLLMLLIETLNNFASTMVKTPVNVFGAALGASALVIGLSSSLYNFTATAVRPFAGFALGRFDNKRWLQICFLLRIVNFIGFALTNSIPLYIASKFFQGLSYALTATVIPAVIGTAVNKKSLGTAFGFYLAAPRLITSFAPMVSMAVYKNFGAQATFFAGAGIIVAAIILTFFLELPKQEKAPAPPQAGAKKPVSLRSLNKLICFDALPICLINLFGGLVFFANSEFLILYGDYKGIPNIAIFFTITNLVSIFARLVGGAITDRFGTDTLFVYMGLILVAPLLIASATNIVPIIIAAFVYQLGQGCLFPATLSLSVNMAKEQDRALATSTFYFLLDFSGVIGAALAGLLVQYFGFEMMYLLFSLCPAMGILVYLSFRKRIKRRMAESLTESESAAA